MTNPSQPIEIQTGADVWATTFSADGKNIISGDKNGVRVWQVKDGQEVTTMKAGNVRCVAVSQDGRWIAAGSYFGYVHVWDTVTYQEVLKHRDDAEDIHGVDFSPDSAQLVSASWNRTAILWDIDARETVLSQAFSLSHKSYVIAAKFSPQDDRIATATYEGSVRVWNTRNGHLLADIPMKISPLWNRGLVWFDSSLLVISDGKIKKLDLSTGVTLTWPVLSGCTTPIALSKHGGFIAHYTSDNTVVLSSSQLHFTKFQHPQHIESIALSPYERHLAIGSEKGSIIIRSLSRFASAPVPASRLHPTLQVPDIYIQTSAIDSWGQLEDTDTLLTAASALPWTPSHHTLACRSFVRARLQRWDTALADAEKAIEIEPSVIGYIAKSIAHVGGGDRLKAYRSIDIAIERFHSSHVTFLLLIKAIIVFMAGDHADAISRIDDLTATVPLIPLFYIVQAYMYLLVGNYEMENSNYNDAIQSFEHARAKLLLHSSDLLSVISLIFGWKFDNLHITLSQRSCEALCFAGRTKEAGDYLLEIVHSFEEDVYSCGATIKWVSDFTQRCLSTTGCYDAQSGDSAALYTDQTPLLTEWVRATLMIHHWKDAMVTAGDVCISFCSACPTLCEHLEATEHVADATECLLEMAREMSQEVGPKQAWIIDLRNWCGRKLETLGDLAMDVRQHSTAIVKYSAALSLDPIHPQCLFVKRSQARAIMGLWEGALEDANHIIILYPSSPLGYERKHEALRVAGNYCDAEDAFEIMLSKMAESADPEIRERLSQYVRPAETEAAIREVIQSAIRGSPLVLINTDTGRLLDKSSQAFSFESQPIFHHLVCSTTTRIDHMRIEEEVGQYYRYAMFSHKWKAREPVYNDVVDAVVYELEASPTNDKLQNFCKVVRKGGLHWAWSDTVCINKSDPSVLQEALVSMFQWYQGSALTVVLLCEAPWKRLVENIWNKRAWTLQEYHASKVVRFHNEDWTLYRGIDVPNHKESPEIIAEMEEATGISAQGLIALRPGLEDIREKLRLASTRAAWRVEDTAYSLLGIFSLSMTVEYGEGDKALGRLLAQLLMSSGDTSILAWTGASGGFNSCLPAKIAVFDWLSATHIPPPMTRTSAEMEYVTARLHHASLNAALVTRFYDQLHRLPVPMFIGKRVMLPSVTFKLGPLSVSQNGSERVFRARTTALGTVEIKTTENLSKFKLLTLVHPWIDFLLDRQPVGSVTDTIPEENADLLSLSDPFNVTLVAPRTRASSNFPSFGLFGGRTATPPSDTRSLQPPSTITETNKQSDAFRALARLRQPFGALLMALDPGNVAAYKRVATDSLITVQVQEITPALLDALIPCVRVLGVL